MSALLSVRRSLHLFPPLPWRSGVSICLAGSSATHQYLCVCPVLTTDVNTASARAPPRRLRRARCVNSVTRAALAVTAPHSPPPPDRAATAAALCDKHGASAVTSRRKRRSGGEYSATRMHYRRAVGIASSASFCPLARDPPPRRPGTATAPVMSQRRRV